MKLKSLTATLIAGGLLAAGTASALDWSPSTWIGSTNKPSMVQTAISPSAGQVASAPSEITIMPNYRAIVEEAGPAVVGITTEGMTRTTSKQVPGMSPEHPFFDFFNGMPGFGTDGSPPVMPARGHGSGFLVDESGIILTNAHVVRDASEVRVKLSDRREFKAKVLGSDASTDVAVLKIDASDLPVVQLGNPARLGVGDHVLAIGSPFGFEQSATAGIVSAKGRSLPGDSYVPFIQTDVAVNPGNSGGPLFDAQGHVVGINSQIYSRTGGYQGVSFAIPIDVALRIKDQIVQTGKVDRVKLGVTVQDVSHPLAQSFKLDKPAGALISSLTPGSTAERAGLKSGDVILAYNGQPISSAGDLTSRIGLAKPGERVTFDIWRQGEKQQVATTLAAADNVAEVEQTAGTAIPGGVLGVVVRPLTPEERNRTATPGGVVVQQAGGPAAQAGIQEGDIILSVADQPVVSVDTLKEAIKKNEKVIALLIHRDNGTIFVPVPLS